MQESPTTPYYSGLHGWSSLDPSVALRGNDRPRAHCRPVPASYPAQHMPYRSGRGRRGTLRTARWGESHPSGRLRAPLDDAVWDGVCVDAKGQRRPVDPECEQFGRRRDVELKVAGSRQRHTVPTAVHGKWDGATVDARTASIQWDRARDVRVKHFLFDRDEPVADSLNIGRAFERDRTDSPPVLFSGCGVDPLRF